ncbi:MAG: hypothetical protein M1343_08305 [Chloroflexi bacterium]|nr:hypothetical protein [Chloroflexota bacterium]
MPNQVDDKKAQGAERTAEAVVELRTPDIVSDLQEFLQNKRKIEELQSQVEAIEVRQEAIKGRLLPTLKDIDGHMIRFGDVAFKYLKTSRTTVSWKEAFKLVLSKVNAQTKAVMEQTVKDMSKTTEYENIKLDVARKNLSAGPLDFLRDIWDKLTGMWQKFSDFLSNATDELESLGEPPVPEEAQASRNPLVRMDAESESAANEFLADYREHRERCAERCKQNRWSASNCQRVGLTPIKRTRYGDA